MFNYSFQILNEKEANWFIRMNKHFRQQYKLIDKINILKMIFKPNIS
jgi:hypothetical protein